MRSRRACRRSRPPGWLHGQQPARLATAQPAWGISTDGRSSNLLWIFSRPGSEREDSGARELGVFIPAQESSRGNWGSQDPESIIAADFEERWSAVRGRTPHLPAGLPGRVGTASSPGSRSGWAVVGKRASRGLGQLSRRGCAVGGNSELRCTGEEVGTEIG
jgi:hypothetical protein